MSGLFDYLFDAALFDIPSNDGGLSITEAGDSAGGKYWSETYWTNYWSVNYWAYFATQGEVLVQGALSKTEAADSAAISGDVEVSGAVAAAETRDTATCSGAVVIAGELSASDAADVFSATADHGVDVVEGTALLAESRDACATAGDVLVQGGLSAPEGSDSAVFTGAEPNPEPLPLIPQRGGFPVRFRFARALELDARERRDECRMTGEVDWSGDDEEILLMSNAA